MEFKVRFRPKDATDYPELVMIVKLDENSFNITSWISQIDKDRQILEKAVKEIREKLINQDIINVEKI